MINIHRATSGLLINDQNYGLKFAPWDAAAPTLDDVKRMLQSLIACNQLNEFVVVLNSAWDKCHIPVEELHALNFKDVSPFFR